MTPTRYERALSPGQLSCSTKRLDYGGLSLIRNTLLLGPYRRPMPRVLGVSSRGVGVFLWARHPLRSSLERIVFVSRFTHACVI